MPSNSARNSQIIALRKKGVGPREIARRLGHSPHIVAGVLFRAGLSTSPKGRAFAISPEKVRAIRKARSDGAFVRVVAAEFGVDISTVSRISRRLSRKEISE